MIARYIQYIRKSIHQIGMVIRFKPCQIITYSENGILKDTTCTCDNKLEDWRSRSDSN